MSVDAIKLLRSERKAKLIEIFKELSTLADLSLEGSKQQKIKVITSKKNEIEKYYFDIITKSLLKNRDVLINKLQSSPTKELELELRKNDEQAREFEAEILQEKLLLKEHLNISAVEVKKMKSRLHQLGHKIQN